MPTIDKNARPRAYDLREERYAWEFSRIPTHIKLGGKKAKSPFRKSAVFVVHGIGNQEAGQTAVGLRTGMELAVPLVELKKWDEDASDSWVVPQPYLWDANWADYSNFDLMEPEAKDHLTDQALDYFRRLWPQASLNAVQSVGWLFSTSVRLCKKGEGIITKLIYFTLAALIPPLAGAMLVLPQGRRFLKQYANDARLYLDPKGDIQHHIVQKIEHMVGEQFLALIGVDWNFDPLEDDQKLRADDQSHEFDKVTWVAHSLGTLISFNVISDILARCEDLRKEGGKENVKKAHKVESALSGFITLGSPLDKIAYIYAETGTAPVGSMLASPNEVLRPWPDAYLPGGKFYKHLGNKNPNDPKEKVPFWRNYYYGTDPVSGPIDHFFGLEGQESPVLNIHTRKFKIPVASHTGYWSDENILIRILEQTFLGFTKRVVDNHREVDETKALISKTWEERSRSVYILGQGFLMAVLIAFYVWIGSLIWSEWSSSVEEDICQTGEKVELPCCTVRCSTKLLKSDEPKKGGRFMKTIEYSG